MVRKFFLSTVFALSILLTGCISTLPQIASHSTGHVQQGIVMQVNEVKLSNQRTQLGITGGIAALSGLLANQLAHKQDHRTRAAATIAGSAAGGVAGHVAGDRFSKTDGYEYIVQVNGRMASLSQPQSAGYFAPGTPVLIIRNGGHSRIVPSQIESGSPQATTTQSKGGPGEIQWRKVTGSPTK